MVEAKTSSAEGDHAPPRGMALYLATLGIVFGDIGTSPLYALRECFYGEHGVEPTHANILGVLSLIVWALTIVVSVKYLLYVMRADNRGEGGVLALMALASSSSQTWTRNIVVILGLFGAALLYGDGIITPAISVLSAVEGLEVAAPALHAWVVPITVVVLIGLFSVQRRGTAGVGAMFGPVTVVWFAALAALGANQIVHNPEVLGALSPHYGARFLLTNHWHGFLVLGSVFLVVTGGEALYADMGHFGIRPIRRMWFAVVMPALVINYMGQGAQLMSNPASASNPFYLMAPSWALYPLLLLSTLATVIASQAVISGAFSLTRQATMLGFWPRVRILHTSAKEIGQIYVPVVNSALMLATIALVIGFGSSAALASAYGIAVTTTMVITTLLAYVVSRRSWGFGLLASWALTGIFLLPDLAFFSANVIKIEQGGWFPLLVAVLVFFLMTTWRKGVTRLRTRIFDQLVPLEDFFELMRIERPARVPGTAVFMTSATEGAPPALMQSLYHNRAVHKHAILMTIKIEEVPYISEEERVSVQTLEHGFHRIIARYGFMETPNIPALLARDDTPTPPIEHTTFYLGRETIVPEGRHGMSVWRTKLFAMLARNALPANAFFEVPPSRVLEVGAQIEL